VAKEHRAANPMTIRRTARQLFLRWHPSDRAVMALLALAVLSASVRLPVVGPSLLPLLELHAALLLGFTAAVVAWTRWEQWPGVAWLRPALTVTVIFTCYTSLGKLGVALWPELSGPPYRDDAWLSAVDNRLLGGDPSLWIQRFQTPGRVEFFSFIYGAFIPYIYLSMALGCLGRPPLERDQFLTGWVFTYFLSFLGYLFVPAHGPVVFHAADYSVTLRGGAFYAMVLRGVEASGGLQGAFPSLHVGGSVYLCLFDLKTNRLRGLTYLPMVLLIYVSTVMLRYHYVIDLIAGTVIAVGCVPLGRRVFARWARRRQAAGRPALPGGEGDVVPDVSGAGAPTAAPLLPAV
jgi:membrane-associated phospholipid phosphatase